MLKRLFTNSLLYSLGPIVPKVLSLLIALPLLTEHLTAVDFGVFGVVAAASGALNALTDLGMGVLFFNSYYKSPSRFKWRWRQLYGVLCWWSVIYTFLLVGAIILVLPPEAHQDLWMICLLSVGALTFGKGAYIGNLFFQLEQKAMPITVRAFLTGILHIFISIYTIVYLDMGYMGWFWAGFISTALSNLSYIYPVLLKEGIWPILLPRWSNLRQWLKVSLPVIPHYYASYLLDISDRLVMRFLNVSTDEIGSYNVAYLFGNYFKMLGLSSGSAIAPMLMQQYKKGRDDIARDLVFALMIIFLLSSFVACLWMKEVFALLIRNEVLAQMYPLGIIIGMSYTYRPMYLGANQKLFYAEQTKKLWKISFVAGISNLLLNLLLIPIFGYQAAAYTTFASLMYMGFSGFFFPTFKELHSDNYYPLYWLSLILAATAGAYFLVEYSWPIKLFCSAISSAIGLFFLWKLGMRLKKAGAF